MRSPISLGLLFLAMAGFSIAGLGGAKLGVPGYALVGLLGAAGLLVMTGHRSGFYLGLVAAGITAMTGLVAWAGLGGGRYGLPIHPGVSIGVGLYLCSRVALAHRQFFHEKRPRLRLSDESDDSDDSAPTS